MEEHLSKRSKQKIKQILDVAEALFLEDGLRQISIEQIVSSAQVSKATFYKYFKNKEELISHMLTRIGEEYKEKLQAMIKRSKEKPLTTDDFLSLFSEESYDKYYQSEFVLELMQDYPQLLVEMSLQHNREIIPAYKEFIRIAKIDGIIRLEIDPDVFIAYTQILKKGIRETIPLPPGMDMKEFTKHLVEMYLYGIMNQ